MSEIETWAPSLPEVPAAELLTGRVIDVMVWGASRPALFERTIMSFRERARFSGRLRFFLEDGAFHPRRAAESAALAHRLGFDGVNVERVGSYGWAMTRAMARWQRAPLMFSLEDDWLCLRDLPLDLAFDAFTENAGLNQLKFNRRANDELANGVIPLVRRTLRVGGREYPCMNSMHWHFNPAIWRRSYFWPRWRGCKDNVHHYVNGPGHVFLPPGPRPSPAWYADTLGALTWGDVGEAAFFEHIGTGDYSVHAAQGRV